MNQNYSCPSCGAVVAFQSSVAVFAVCSHCQSMVVRHDVDVEAIGKMAALPPDLSPLQLGATGEFDGTGFTLLGRVRFSYADGSWNEWFAQFGDGRQGWVAEAQGFFMVSFQIEPPAEIPAYAGNLPVDSYLEIESENYHVVDRKQTTCLGGEGELPFVAPPGREATCVDLTGNDGRYASIEFAEAGRRVFTGRYAQFNDLKFANLKNVPGWSGDETAPIPNETTALQCPNCGATVVLRATGFTMSATCGSCRSLIDTSTPELSLILRAQKNQTITPKIPLGRRGKLFDVNYEVIGFQHVKDNYSGWFEYLLFNPWQGFVWLVNYHGHWSFVRRLTERPEVIAPSSDETASHVNFRGHTYRLFDAGPVSTDYVLGEFYWKVSVGMKTVVNDFVCPPWILSRETYPQLTEETWSQGEYIEPAVLEKAFGLPPLTPERSGIYLNQPNPYAAKGRELAWLVPVFLVILATVQFVSLKHAAHQPIYSNNFTYDAGATNPVIVTEPFELKGGNQALEFVLHAPVDNNWLELDIDVINADTHLSAGNFVQGLEFYHGYDDGNWAEGRQTESYVEPEIAPGKYYLAIEPSADHAVGAMPFSVKIVRDVLIWSNFWIALALLLIYPLYCWTRAWVFEHSRWMESDFTPAFYAGYQSSDSDD